MSVMDGSEAYRQNAKWLAYFAPFRALSISAAYLTPFFIQKGLSLSEVFLLQSIFSAALLCWEIPSGFIADRFGRAFSLKLAAPIATVALIAYGFCGHYWQFVVCELGLALANGLISGVDKTLLYDSLKAEGYEGKELNDMYTENERRMNAYGFYAVVCGVPVGALLVSLVSISATLVADGLLSAVGVYFAFKLAEAPRYNGGQEAVRLSAWRAARQLGSNVEARWLVVLGTALSAATWLGFWLSAPYYEHLGIPAVLFGAILAVRNLLKAVLSHPPKWLRRRWPRQLHWHVPIEPQMWLYGTLAGMVYLAMATGQVWLIWAVLGHDIVHALQSQPITTSLNVHMHSDHRATMNSLVNLVQRLVFTVAGPLTGLLIDRAGLTTGFVVTGLACSTFAFVALARLHRLDTFKGTFR